jgi:hypothetical protein
VSGWCARTGTTPGAIVPLGTVWDLARLWYGDRLDATFRGRGADEAEAIFRRVGLTASFWRLDPPQDTSGGE